VQLSTVLKNNPVYRKRESILANILEFVDSRYHKNFIGTGFSISPGGNLFECNREYTHVLDGYGWLWLWRHDNRIISKADIPGDLEHVNKKTVMSCCRELMRGLIYNVPSGFFNDYCRQHWELVRIDCYLYWGIPFTSFITKESFEETWKQYFGEDSYPPEINDKLWRE